MNKLKLICLTSLLVSGAAVNAASCDDMQIKLKNNLADDLLLTQIKLSDADIQPGTFQKLKSGTEQIFTVNHSAENVPLAGEFTLKTISLPIKTVKIRYTLENKPGICEHTDIAQKSDYSVTKSRGIGEVTYNISNQ